MEPTGTAPGQRLAVVHLIPSPDSRRRHTRSASGATCHASPFTIRSRARYAQPVPANGASPKKLKLYVLTGSHPCAAVEVALGMKSIPYSRVDLLPLVQMAAGPLLYGGITVPGVRMDGEKMVGSRHIMRRLDELVSEPALLPADTAERAKVLEAERWGDEVFQAVPRRILDAAFLRNAGCMESYVPEDAKLPLPRAAMRPTLPLMARLMALRNRAKDENVRADLGGLPEKLGKIDAWIAEGVIGGEQPNAADLQIGSTIRLLNTIADVRPLLDGHTALELERYFPPMVGEVPAGTLPAELLA
jgi:glutathione S-transferase